MPRLRLFYAIFDFGSHGLPWQHDGHQQRFAGPGADHDFDLAEYDDDWRYGQHHESQGARSSVGRNQFGYGRNGRRQRWVKLGDEYDVPIEHSTGTHSDLDADVRTVLPARQSAGKAR